MQLLQSSINPEETVLFYCPQRCVYDLQHPHYQGVKRWAVNSRCGEIVDYRMKNQFISFLCQ